jgi:aldehyde:ferredoxin oxidoreductase
MQPPDYVGVPDHPPVSRFDYGGKGAIAAETVKLMHAVNCSGCCAFIPLSFADLTSAVRAITGHPYDYEELLAVGERVAILRQAFNLREGLSPSSFALPERVRGNPPLEGGPTAGVTIDLSLQNDHIYRAMDWDPVTGLPSRHRPMSLGGLEDVCHDLYATMPGG